MQGVHCTIDNHIDESDCTTPFNIMPTTQQAADALKLLGA